MPRRSAAQRLATLKAKEAAIQDAIKQIEREQSRELRKTQERRNRIVGAAMYKLIEVGEWTEEELLALVTPVITSGKDKRFMGIEGVEKEQAAVPPAKTSKSSPSTMKKKATRSAPQQQDAKQRHSKGDAKRKVQGKTQGKAQALPESADQQALADAFNLE